MSRREPKVESTQRATSFVAAPSATHSRDEANARLIAAAPALLAACEAIIARRSGRWDAPELVAMGPLSIDSFAQETEWLRAAVEAALEAQP